MTTEASGAVKITEFRVKGFKGVELVEAELKENGLFIIGGECDQGKSSVLDAIMACLGGERFVPDDALRHGDDTGEIVVKTSNGLVVRRSITKKGTYLTVIDTSTGFKGNQSILDKFVSLFALDCPRFITANDDTRVRCLLQAIGVDLTDINNKRRALTEERLVIGRLGKTEAAVAEAMPFFGEGVTEPIDTSAIEAELDKAMEAVRDIDKRKNQLSLAEERIASADAQIEALVSQTKEYERQIADIQAKHDELVRKTVVAKQARQIVETLREEIQKELNVATVPDLDAINTRIGEAEGHNKRVAANKQRKEAMDNVQSLRDKYAELTRKIEQVDAEQLTMLSGAGKLLPGLTVNADGHLEYNGILFDNLSHSDKLIVTVSVAGAIKPECGFVLVDKLEALDQHKLQEFARIIADKGLQVIATRVSTGPENTIIIGSGKVLQEATSDVPPADDHADEK